MMNVRPLIHLNSAGAGLMSAAVTERQIAHLRLEQAVGGYRAAEQAAEEHELIYSRLARLIRCERSELALLDSSTRAFNSAVFSVPLAPGDEVVSAHGAGEYASNAIAVAQHCRQTGARFRVVPACPRTGGVDFAQLDVVLASGRVKLVLLTHLPTGSAVIADAERVGTRLAATSAAQRPLFVLDACQSIGHVPLDLGRIQCDFLSGTSRKYLCGPRGVGFLYCRASTTGDLEPPGLDLHSAQWTGDGGGGGALPYRMVVGARRYEQWESNVAARLGFGVAVEQALADDGDARLTRIQARAAYLRENLQDTDIARHIVLHDREVPADACSGLVLFSLASGEEPDGLQRRLQNEFNVNTSIFRHSSSPLSETGRPGAIRASVHCDSTNKEIDAFVDVLRQIFADEM